MINTLFVGSTSACFELENDLPYYAEKEYEVFLNGKKTSTENKNVFSLFGLAPDTEYTVNADGEEIKFRTKSEVCALSVRDFGAVGDGKADDTASIETAISCLPAGGRLFFPVGTYLTRPISLKSHMTLELDENAVILGTTEKDGYPVIPAETKDVITNESYITGTWEGNAFPMYKSLIFASRACDISIVGKGAIDGNAQNGTWWHNVKEYTVGRPRLIFFGSCNDVNIHGITAQNSASWQLHPFRSENVGIYDISVYAPKDSPNTDALDPESCKNVNIVGCKFSVGDDCIAVKSGKIDVAKKYKMPAENHNIRNCLMQFGHGAVTLGSETACGIYGLRVSRCIFERTDRGLRIKTRRGRGKDAVIDGVVFENIKMNGVLTPIVINMWYNCCDPDRNSEYVWSRKALPVDERTPKLKKFTFRNIVCDDCNIAACYCDGLPESPIDEISLENIDFSFAENAVSGVPAMRSFIEPMCRAGMYFDNVKSLSIKNVNVVGAIGETLTKHNVENITLE
ncbi:MAG: glycoside hydrolase family 28 protein [Clostridiales bacterium]|nr:glycoside hydrolase family 28 protein [Clostridiales bacterium]